MSGQIYKFFSKRHKKSSKNSFVDDAVLDFYMSNKIKNILQDPIKRLLNFSNKYSYELSNQKFLNAINAETKQGIATLFDVDLKTIYRLKTCLIQKI